MKTHLPSAVILCASLVLFCVHSFATENQTSLTASPIATSQTSGGGTSSSQGGFVLIPPLFYFRGFSRRIPLCHGTNHRYPSGGNHGGRGNHPIFPPDKFWTHSFPRQTRHGRKEPSQHPPQSCSSMLWQAIHTSL